MSDESTLMMNRIQAAAANIADWHECSLRALGRETRRTEALWSCESGPGIIYLMAITLGPRDESYRQLSEMEAFSDRRSGDRIVVSDTWDSLDLGARGYLPSPYGAEVDWYWRPPESSAEGTAVPPRELAIQRVSDTGGLREYEQVSVRGFGSEELLNSVGAFGIHAPGILDDPRMRIYIGRMDGRTVTGAMAYVSDDVIGVYGVVTPPEHRRKGYGEAITRAAVSASPDLPSWLQPSGMAAAMYRRIGFEKIGGHTAWLRPAAT